MIISAKLPLGFFCLEGERAACFGEGALFLPVWADLTSALAIDFCGTLWQFRSHASTSSSLQPTAFPPKGNGFGKSGACRGEEGSMRS
jgi:hypothetical protein